ncbi:MAG TPA: NUDIX hydrolase [Rectinemataceae bacterium]|nr:NUDIX hydrolase [Rectinemataceae bacterium]
MAEVGWKKGRVVERFDGKILDIKRVECESASGKRAVFTSVAARDWAIVVPLVQVDGVLSCVMVRQYRHGANGFFVEFPGGIIEEGEDTAVGVGRELEEETGWKAGSIKLAGKVSPNPAFMENSFYVFVAMDLEYHGRTDFDEHEEIETLIIPIDEVRRSMGTGEYANAMMVTGLFLAERALRGSTGI